MKIGIQQEVLGGDSYFLLKPELKVHNICYNKRRSVCKHCFEDCNLARRRSAAKVYSINKKKFKAQLEAIDQTVHSLMDMCKEVLK